MKAAERNELLHELEDRCKAMDWSYLHTEDPVEYQHGVDRYAQIRHLVNQLGDSGERILSQYKPK